VSVSRSSKVLRCGCARSSIQIKSGVVLFTVDMTSSSGNLAFMYGCLYDASYSQRDADRGIRRRVPHLRAGRRSLRRLENTYLFGWTAAKDHRRLRRSGVRQSLVPANCETDQIGARCGSSRCATSKPERKLTYDYACLTARTTRPVLCGRNAPAVCIRLRTCARSPRSAQGCGGGIVERPPQKDRRFCMLQLFSLRIAAGSLSPE